jgi:hypothetical protein
MMVNMIVAMTLAAVVSSAAKNPTRPMAKPTQRLRERGDRCREERRERGRRSR